MLNTDLSYIAFADGFNGPFVVSCTDSLLYPNILNNGVATWTKNMKG